MAGRGEKKILGEQWHEDKMDVAEEPSWFMDIFGTRIS